MPLSPLRVAPGGRYFETFDGEPFLMVGFNDAISWETLDGLFRRKDLPRAEAYLEDLAAHGINTLRLMLEYVHRESRYFESRVGVYNPNMIRLWDDLFAICERVGIRVLLTPWDTFWMTRRWKKHPYNALNGGPAQKKSSVLTDPLVFDVLIDRFRFVIERWGQSGVIAAWDLWNEIWTHWGGTIEEQESVFSRMSEAVRTIEMETWGWSRPQTISIFGPNLAHGYENLIFRHPNIDFATSHIYAAGTIDDPKNTVNPAITMGREVRYSLSHVPPHYPFLDTEHGPIHLFNDKRKWMPEPMDDEYERHLMWAHLASGGAGSGMRWPARHPHVITQGTKRSLHNMTKFLPLIDWQNFAPHDAVPHIELREVSATARPGKLIKNIQAFGCRDDSQAVLWLLSGNPIRNTRGMLPAEPTPQMVVLTLGQSKPGHYTLQEWDTKVGRAGACYEAMVGSDGVLRCVIRDFGNDLALAVRRRD